MSILLLNFVKILQNREIEWWRIWDARSEKSEAGLNSGEQKSPTP